MQTAEILAKFCRLLINRYVSYHAAEQFPQKTLGYPDTYRGNLDSLGRQWYYLSS